MKDRFHVLVAGKAGDGVKKAALVIGQTLAQMGRNVFQLDDYQSLIKGGLNFSIISSDIEPITSHYADIDLMIVFDDRNLKLHKDLLDPEGILIYNSDESQSEVGIGLPLNTMLKDIYSKPQNVSLVVIGAFAATIGLSKEKLESIVRKRYRKNVDENLAYAIAIYNKIETKNYFTLKETNNNYSYLTGNQTIVLGSYAGGLEMYYAYPMTPSSTILHYFARNKEKFGIQAIHVENEIAAPMMAMGSIFTGAKAAVGSATGGFALMQEAYSMAGMAEAPLLCLVSSRPGPATGVSTYTAQEDLHMMLNQGHGEFPRIVASPPHLQSAYELSAELLDLAWKFQVPTILLTEKHLSESSMTVNLDLESAKWASEKLDSENSAEYSRYKLQEDGISPLRYAPSDAVIKWNSHEHFETGMRTDQPHPIIAMKEKRKRKEIGISQYLSETKTIETFGEQGPIILTYGSTFLSAIEITKHLDFPVRVVAPIYLKPVQKKLLNEYKNDKVIILEYSLDQQFTEYINQNTDIEVLETIIRYDGRPFEPLELAEQIKEILK